MGCFILVVSGSSCFSDDISCNTCWPQVLYIADASFKPLALTLSPRYWDTGISGSFLLWSIEDLQYYLTLDSLPVIRRFLSLHNISNSRIFIVHICVYICVNMCAHKHMCFNFLYSLLECSNSFILFSRPDILSSIQSILLRLSPVVSNWVALSQLIPF